MSSLISETTDTTVTNGGATAAWIVSASLGGAVATSHAPPWAAMWLIAAGLFFAAKAMTLHKRRSPLMESLVYTFCWPGLSPPRFSRSRRSTSPHPLVIAGLMNLIFGAVLLWIVARQFNVHPMVAAWVGMIGLVFVLHFGTFHLITAFWMHMGRDVEPLMCCPIAAKSLGNFWSRRWNIAFRDLTHSLVFRPATIRLGATAALWLVFGVSGLLHEIVISVPAGAGYGGPTTYFLFQALGIQLAHAFKPLDGRAWAFAFLLLPVGLLVHPPFVHRVMIPFFQSIGALP